MANAHMYVLSKKIFEGFEDLQNQITEEPEAIKKIEQKTDAISSLVSVAIQMDDFREWIAKFKGVQYPTLLKMAHSVPVTEGEAKSLQGELSALPKGLTSDEKTAAQMFRSTRLAAEKCIQAVGRLIEKREHWEKELMSGTKPKNGLDSFLDNSTKLLNLKKIQERLQSMATDLYVLSGYPLLR